MIYYAYQTGLPILPHPAFVRGLTCYLCGEAECRESMPHGVHPDWLKFIELHGSDSFSKQRILECEALPDRRSPE